MRGSYSARVPRSSLAEVHREFVHHIVEDEVDGNVHVWAFGLSCETPAGPEVVVLLCFFSSCCSHFLKKEGLLTETPNWGQKSVWSKSD